MTLDLKKDNFAFSFNGSLEQQTLNRIFQVPPLEGSLIQGDIEVSAFLRRPCASPPVDGWRAESSGCR